MIDWDRVYQIGSLLSGDTLRSRSGNEQRLRRETYFRQLVQQVSQPMMEYLRVADGSFCFVARPEALDRAAWIEANIGGFGTVFEPVESALRQRLGNRVSNPLNQQTSSILLGVLLGYLSRHVLGQYDPSLLGKEAATAGRLYFVEPNLESARRKMSLPKEQFETWIVFHELTHAWQFEAHPWLRQHMNQQIRELLMSASDRLLQFDAAELLRLAMRGQLDLRQPQRLLTGLMNPHQQRIFDGLQALMSLLEGFSNHVMDALGPRMLPDYARIAATFEDRQRHKSPAETLFIRMTGLEVKLQQYQLGEAFVDAVVRRVGIEGMNQVWTSPDCLPSLQEIHQPELWLVRMEARAA